MRKVILGLVAVWLSCGSSNSSQAPLNAAFAGTWAGTITFSGTITGSANAQLIISGVNGNSMQIGPLCPDGTGTVTATGSGNTASWSGSLACAPTSGLSNCPSAVLTFTSLSSALSGTTLSGTADGNLSGCPSGNGAFHINFSATH